MKKEISYPSNDYVQEWLARRIELREKQEAIGRPLYLLSKIHRRVPGLSDTHEVRKLTQSWETLRQELNELKSEFYSMYPGQALPQEPDRAFPGQNPSQENDKKQSKAVLFYIQAVVSAVVAVTLIFPLWPLEEREEWRGDLLEWRFISIVKEKRNPIWVNLIVAYRAFQYIWIGFLVVLVDMFAGDRWV